MVNANYTVRPDPYETVRQLRTFTVDRAARFIATQAIVSIRPATWGNNTTGQRLRASQNLRVVLTVLLARRIREVDVLTIVPTPIFSDVEMLNRYFL
jgi:hypothetical protein